MSKSAFFCHHPGHLRNECLNHDFGHHFFIHSLLNAEFPYRRRPLPGAIDNAIAWGGGMEVASKGAMADMVANDPAQGVPPGPVSRAVRSRGW